MNRLPRIGVDLMGCDTPPEVLLKALLLFAPKLEKEAELVVFATRAYIPDPVPAFLSFCAVEQVITMQESPLLAVRRKREASLCLGMRKLHTKELDAFITGGNTGALIASAKLSLPMLEKIERPALMTLLPTEKEPMAVLDVGANVTSTRKHLEQFAYMGIAYQKSRGLLHPRVALLNNGTEENKGTTALKEAYQALKKWPYFVGNVEGRDVFSGKIDVLVTDGFTGNIFLKTAEGMGAYILHLLDKMQSTIPPQLYSRLHYAEYPGAILSGVEGTVLKFHGNASTNTLIESIQEALTLVKQNFLERTKRELLHATSCIS